MFEEELELEKKEGGNFGPLLIIFLLVAIFAGGIGYVIYTSKQTLKVEEASQVITDSLKARGPATVKFHSGQVVPSVSEKTDGPHYRLLEKAGIVKVSKSKSKTWGAIEVALTPEGEKTITSFPEFAKNVEKDGSTQLIVPLAKRTLVQVGEIKKISPTRFQVEYTWKWEPNQLGQAFDTKGAFVQSFNTWERSQLIKDYGADLYSDPPQKISVIVVKTDKGWKLASE